jgi:hypothetical protein
MQFRAIVWTAVDVAGWVDTATRTATDALNALVTMGFDA